MNKFILLLMFVLVSCSQGKVVSNASIVVSFQAITGATFTGGALIQVVNVKTGEVKVFDLIPPYNVTLPFGVWSFHFVGFEEASWQGPHVCGGADEFEFNSDKQSVQIYVDAAKCEIQPYTTLISSKAGSKWDVAIWDQSKWE